MLDQTACPFPEGGYRVQVPPDGNWTEWRTLDIPIKEPLILSLQVNEKIFKLTKKQLKISIINL